MVKVKRLAIIALSLLAGCGTFPPSAPSEDVTGSWTIYYYTSTQTKDSMDLTQDGNMLHGIWSARDMPMPVDVTGAITGATLCIDVPIPDVPCRIDAKVSQEGKVTMAGTWTVYSGPLKGTHPWRAEKGPCMQEDLQQSGDTIDSEQSPETYSSKAVNGATGNAPE